MIHIIRTLDDFRFLLFSPEKKNHSFPEATKKVGDEENCDDSS